MTKRTFRSECPTEEDEFYTPLVQPVCEGPGDATHSVAWGDFDGQKQSKHAIIQEDGECLGRSQLEHRLSLTWILMIDERGQTEQPSELLEKLWKHLRARARFRDRSKSRT